MKYFPHTALLTLAAVSLLTTAAPGRAVDWPIITRRGDELVEGTRPFRFLGLAAPNLHHNESQVKPDFSNRFPDEFESRDTLDSLRRLGGRATRMFGFTIASPVDKGLPAYVTGRRQYNEDAFRSLDRVLALGQEYDIRVIIPLIASQSFAGVRGTDEFAALSGKTAVGAFWTDAEVKDDFKAFITYLVNRRNTVSGLRYGDDPAILAWQLGNEFDSYAPDRKLDADAWRPIITAWALEMAAFIKSQDPRHLVMEAGGDRHAMIADANIDVISTHLYEYWNRLGNRPTWLAPLAKADRDECRGKKPLMIDEFGLGTVENMRALMETIRTENIVGGLLWSIRPHRRDGGFYCHNEGGTPVNSYHIPGFAVSHAYDATRMLNLLRAESFAIRGLPVPPLERPAPAPVLFTAGHGFTWRGSTGASHYAIERAPSPEGPWTVMADGLADSVHADVKTYEASGESAPPVLWSDEYAAPGTTFHYRVHGFNAAGATDYSTILRVEKR